MYKVKNKIAPVNLRDLFDEISDINSYSARSVTAGNFYNFYIKHTRLEIQKSSFSKFAAKAWSSIPTHFKQLKYSNFKKQLHETLMQQILKDQDGYLALLSILQQLASFS